MAKLYEMEPDVLRLDDKRIAAYRDGFIDEMDLLRLVKSDDPFQMINGRMHYFTKEERQRQIDGFVKNQKGMLKKYGGLHGMMMKNQKDMFLAVYPELEIEYVKIEEEIKKEQCPDCVANQKYHRVLDLIVTNQEYKTRDVSSLEGKVPPLAMKILKGEVITDDEIPVDVPLHIKKIDIPFIDAAGTPREFDPTLDTVARKACWDCTKKHLADALVLMPECILGYGTDAHLQKWELIGHLSQAAKECAAVNPELAGKIRNFRLKIMRQKSQEAPANA